MTTSEAHDAITSQRGDVHWPLRGLAAAKSANRAQARRGRGLCHRARCRLARRSSVQPACARACPSQGCAKMTSSEARHAATSQRGDVHWPLRGLAAAKSANLAQARRVRSLCHRARCRLVQWSFVQPACARGHPSQGCAKMTSSETRHGATSQRGDVHWPLPGLAAAKSANRAQARIVIWSRHPSMSYTNFGGCRGCHRECHGEGAAMSGIARHGDGAALGFHQFAGNG